MAGTLVTLAQDERAWGKAWHAPTVAPISIRELADRYCAMVSVPPVKIHRLPRALNHAAGLVYPMAREMAEMDYQFYKPYHLDSTLTERTFGLTPAPTEVGLRETAADAAAISARTM
jgi:nucleoside-diphosphate-sugar epimerase